MTRFVEKSCRSDVPRRGSYRKWIFHPLKYLKILSESRKNENTRRQPIVIKFRNENEWWMAKRTAFHFPVEKKTERKRGTLKWTFKEIVPHRTAGPGSGVALAGFVYGRFEKRDSLRNWEFVAKHHQFRQIKRPEKNEIEISLQECELIQSR